MAMNGVIVNLMLFINLFAGPVALQNIGYKYVFVSFLLIGGTLTTYSFGRRRSSSDGTASRRSSGGCLRLKLPASR